MPLQPHANYILNHLLSEKVFYILPSLSYYPLNPRDLPREVFTQDHEGPDSFTTRDYNQLSIGAVTPGEVSKKKGRPKKSEKLKKAKNALISLENWLEDTAHSPRTQMPCAEPSSSTDVLPSNQPSTSRQTYRSQKTALLGRLDTEEGRRIVDRVNDAVLARMRRIDQLAAEKGLEVGGEGGEHTGLSRVEKAVNGLRREGGGGGGLLELLEGVGLDDNSLTAIHSPYHQ